MSTRPASSRRIAGDKTTPARPHLVTMLDERSQREFADASETEVAVEATRAPGLELHTYGEPAVQFREAPTPSASLNSAVKRVVDVVGSVLLAIVFSPLILAIPFMMSKDGGGIIYRHRRIGYNGRMFDCLKFRTMIPNADEALSKLLEHPEMKAEWLRDRKLRHDPRITRLGRFLRRTSLDELPQIWNVLRGEMSLVGPRPVVREELLRYGTGASAYLAAKPGITGLWQVTGRNDTDYRRRVILDTFYVCNHNLLLDCYILLRTTGVVLGGNGAY